MRSIRVAAAVLSGALSALPAHAEEPPTLGAASAAPDVQPYLVGLERTLSDAIVTGEGRSLAGYLSSALNHPVKGRIYKTYDDLSQALAKGEVDFAWINPYAYVKAAEGTHIFPIAKALRKGASYRAVLFVRSDSKVKDLKDLKGLRVAWVDQTSTAGYLFPQAMLLQQKITPATFFSAQSFAGTHRAVCDAVSSGAADVGATFHTGDDQSDLQPDGCIETMGDAAAKQLRGIAASGPIPSEVIAARPGFDEAVSARLAGIFAEMGDTESGRALLKSVFRANGFGLALDTDYDVVREAAKMIAAAQPKAEPPAKKSRKRKSKKSKKS